MTFNRHKNLGKTHAKSKFIFRCQRKFAKCHFYCQFMKKSSFTVLIWIITRESIQIIKN